MVDLLEARGDVGLDDPFRSHPVSSQALQSCVAASSWAESVAVVVEGRFIDGFQNQSNAFLDDFVPWRWYPEGPSFPLVFGMYFRLTGVGLVLFRSQQVDQFLNVFHAVAIQRLAICTWRHIARLALQSFVGHDVECWIVQESV